MYIPPHIEGRPERYPKIEVYIVREVPIELSFVRVITRNTCKLVDLI
jgi:hypothetical protein